MTAPSRLREAAPGAVDRGLGFVEASVRSDGARTSRSYPDPALEGSRRAKCFAPD